MKHFKITLPAAFALAIALSAAPAAAQKGEGHGGGHGKDHPKHEEVRAGAGRVEQHGRAHTETRVAESRARRTTTRGSSARTAPPGWCQGRGNPHNTAANCGYRTDRVYRDRNGVWRDRYGNRLANGGIYRDRSGTLRDYLGRLLR
ncbi:MAG: hypothetical protein JWM27_425 [Gemmatimonadetes bacterium]|nr:hypothetical protein [Gemmatimonadota bacterium]